ncbi:MAG: PspC domain-containing protein [Bacteroidales bacterium]
MKTVMNVGIGGKSFVMEEDAYTKLKRYLNQFKIHTKMGIQTKEVMGDLEERIAELFSEKLNSFQDVVNMGMVNNVINQLGMPDGEPFVDNQENTSGFNFRQESNDLFNGPAPVRRLYRDTLNKSIGGVCSGLAIYFGIDTLLLRILFVIAFFMGSAGFWVYIILWIAVPLAQTPAQKCEMYGLPITAENLRRFTNIK